MQTKCTLEVFENNRWREAAEFSRAGPGWWFDYLPEYVFDDGQPLTLGGNVSLDAHVQPKWPAFLFDLVPQGRGRKYLLDLLHLPDGEQSDFDLMRAGALNPIGNLRIQQAVAFYREHAPADAACRRFDLTDILNRSDEFLDYIWAHAMLNAGTTGLQGVAPKFLLTKTIDGDWAADSALPDEEAAEHWLVKLPRGPGAENATVLRNEYAYLKVAHALGIPVIGEPMLHGNMLFVRRFDRAVDPATRTVTRLSQESLASIARLTGFGLTVSHFLLAQAIARVASDPTDAIADYLKRDLLNLALGGNCQASCRLIPRI